MALKPLKANQLIKEMALERYILDTGQLKQINEKCKEVFIAQVEKKSERFEQIEKTLDFIKTIWRKYDCEQIAEIYDKFIKIEEALFGLEREEEIGERYRDHFIHMFNCFVFGLRVISSLIKQTSQETSQNLFKVQKEILRNVGLPFNKDYEYEQRLFYLWTLVSTFHDIAIPFQHLSRLGRGISRFVDEFGWIFTDPQISMQNFDASQLYYYFDLIASVYGGKLMLINDGQKYARPDQTQYYLVKLLGREFDRKNHGVLSGFFMWKTIEEIFLVGRSPKYRFSIEEFNKYTDYVLEQDIARAALAISLHAIEEDEKTKVYPKIFPIDFGSYPLSFLLILSDELQEYLRWEGVTLKKSLNFNYHPALDIKFNQSNNLIETKVSFSIEIKNKEAIVKQANEVARRSNINLIISDIDGAVDLFGNSMKKNLERKLDIGKNFKLNLYIYQDWSSIIYNKELNSSYKH